MAQLRADAQANRGKILEGAVALFAEKGLGAEMKEIAEASSVAVGTLYRHFPSKDDLRMAVVMEAVGGLLNAGRAADREDDPRVALQVLLTEHFKNVDRYGWLVKSMFAGQLPKSCQGRIEAIQADPAIAGQVRRQIQKGIDAGLLRRDLDVGVSTALLEGVTLPWSYDHFRSGRSPVQSAQAVLGVFLRGAGVEPPIQTMDHK